MTNLAENLTRSAVRIPDRPALRLHDTTYSYSELEELAGRAAGRMAALGVGVGDRVGLMLPNVLEFPVLFYGALRLGAIVVPMNPLLKGREIEHYAGDSGMVLLWAHESVADDDLAGLAGRVGVERVDGSTIAGLRDSDIAPTVDRDDLDTAVILYTSGTTGSPKGAELTHGGLNRNQQICREDLLDVTEQDVVMGCLPLFHVFGLTCCLNAGVAAGALLTLIPRFDPELVLDVIARDGVTIFEGVPTMYTALAHAPGADPSRTASLRVCCSGGASLPADVVRAFEQTFEAKILEGYGLSETSPVASFNRVENAKIGSIGTPIPGVEFRLVNDDDSPTPVGEVGEIAIRGHNVMKGYWNRPEATAEAIRDGWFHTGDMARVDDDGFYYIVDRKKELIIRGGFNVYPREIEEVLYEHPAVREAAVIGIPHPTHGEEIAAAVSLHTGTDVTESDIRDYVKARVAPYKYPRVVWFVDDLPKGATGKILKRAIEPPTSTS
ncbi:Long-chain-fatty-acid--CoA ligase [Nostocoides japonicum T1-X7]|uniref:Long-chain-fatty-acid--CoA ligase n=1 Tax=Nostocoides japonicum T1-X7 TaxID=1194083 RepID=A0A077M137_9MICO|nr:long-chain fatty acid--CoA ligase [Tetrasphaera japonica]CCH79541.1 Long-chain-fatty-acid--CoA ligase [Tetrasphaera japonica T1-X7]